MKLYIWKIDLDKWVYTYLTKLSCLEPSNRKSLKRNIAWRTERRLIVLTTFQGSDVIMQLVEHIKKNGMSKIATMLELTI